MNDLISRQAAIDVLAIGAELLKRVLDDTDVVGFEREKYAWGLGLIEQYISDMKELPSTQPEVLACGSGELVQESDSLVKDLVKDCISRQAAIDTLTRLEPSFRGSVLEQALKNMPPAQPERKIGRWTVTRLYVQCSECGECFPLKPQNYCPNCGARMVITNDQIRQVRINRSETFE